MALTIPVAVGLTRFDKPIGTLLLLWPTMWGLFLASGGIPSAKHLLIFSLGVLLMRSAGCVVNDLWDQPFDGHVRRTQHRPLVSGQATTRDAILLLFILLGAASLLLLGLNAYGQWLAVVALLLAMTYPLFKRVTHLPQLVLSVAFAWGIPMGYAVVLNQVPYHAWLLFVATACWIVSFDTIYAMVDKEDDLKIGVKSTAILFGRYVRLILAFLQIVMVVLLLVVGHMNHLGLVYMLGVGLSSLCFVHQQRLVAKRQREAYFAAFVHNHWFGLGVLLSILLEYCL